MPMDPGLSVDYGASHLVGVGQVYPGLGSTAGLRGSAQSADAGTPGGNAGGAATRTAGAVPVQSFKVPPLAYWIGLALLLVALMFASQRSGDKEDFRSIRLSVYNIMVVTIACVIGLTILKPLAARMQRVPFLDGLAALIIAA